MREIKYNRKKVVEYAEKWAYDRNPKYYNFDKLGGDCTNFISQCIYAGSNSMNYDKTKGWYYINGNNKSPSWTGVQFLYNFLTQNKGLGPYGKKCEKEELEIGDIAQLSFDGNKFAHTLVIVNIEDTSDLNKIYIASHTFNSFNRKIGGYQFKDIRFAHIEGVRKN